MADCPMVECMVFLRDKGEVSRKTLFQIRLTTSFSVCFEPEALAVGSPFRP